MRAIMRILFATIIALGSYTVLDASEPGMSVQEIKSRIKIAHQALDQGDIDEAYHQLDLVSEQANIRYCQWAYWQAWQRWSAFFKAVCLAHRRR